MLRDYLLYTESGGTDLGERQRDRDPLNPFEQDVLSQLSAAGMSLECQVGCSGYWIDFAAKHPSQPGRYVLAIEADGVMYHSSATARDRDRLRQDHLERLGWRFHRIWSTEWFRHREREVARAVAAYEEALRESDGTSWLIDAPEAVLLERPVEDVTASDMAAAREVRRTLPQPWWPDGRQITEYPDYELVKFMRWIMSDGVLRTKEELITIGSQELGYERRGARIVTGLGRIVDTIQRSERKS
jgi:very-short-patch-repair endonuclease